MPAAPKYNDVDSPHKAKQNNNWRKVLKRHKMTKNYKLIIDATELRTAKATLKVVPRKKILSANLNYRVVINSRAAGINTYYGSAIEQYRLARSNGKLIDGTNYDSCGTIGGNTKYGIYPAQDISEILDTDCQKIVLFVTLSQRLKHKKLYDPYNKTPVWKMVQETLEKGIFIEKQWKILETIGAERYSKGDGPMVHFEYVLVKDNSIDPSDAEYWYREEMVSGRRVRTYLGFDPALDYEYV